tara:strand:- start:1795 stop:4056 length:2262 start_codon:yes stop_codon:yes gene_type:complete
MLVSGSDTADIVVFAEPFRGYSNKLFFNDILGRANISQEECLVLQVSGNGYDEADEIYKRITEHPRRLMFIVGEAPLVFVTGESSINRWRGSLLRSQIGILNHLFDQCPIIPMLHPADVLKSYSWLVLCRHDAQRGQQVLQNPDLRHHDLEITQFAGVMRDYEGSTFESFEHFRSKLRSYNDAACIAFDIETYRETITCLGLARSDSDAIVIPLTGEFDNRQTALLLSDCRDILAGEALKVGQNLDYDTQYLARCFGIGVRNVWMDTMVAHSVMHPELSHSLDTLTSLYTLHPFYKEMRKEATEGRYSELLWEYNGIDCCITYQVACELFKEMQVTSTYKFFETVSMPVTKTLVRMENTGVLIDHELRKARGETLSIEVTELLASPALKGVNPNSPKQILEHFAALGVVLPIARGKKKASTDEDSLSLLRAKQPATKPFIDAILGTRERRKIISTYLSAKCHDDGRMRTSYRTSATKTGRLSSSQDVFNKGMNLQNVPVSQRDWFIPSEGKVFWACDASQIEARITAWISGDKRYCTAFLEGRDLHSENASRLFGVRVDRNTLVPGTDVYYRDVGKTATHAMNYMIGPINLARHIDAQFPQLNFKVPLARKFIKEFETMYPFVVSWWGDIYAHLKKSRVIVNAYGRRRVFLDRPNSDKMHKDAVAHLPQSTAADHINLSLVNVESRLVSLDGAVVLLQTHDEIAGECYPGDLDKVKEIVVEEMTKPLPLFWNGIQLIVPAEFGSGPNWMDTHG